MSQAFYDDIAEWYDGYLSENTPYQEVVLPTLLKFVGNVQGQRICDLGCGQGWLTRELARKGAQMTGIDLSDQLLTIARQYEEREPLGIVYRQGDAQRVEAFAEGEFDGCMCIWSLVDIPDLQAVFQSMRRLLKPGGWLIFAIAHPCFEAPNARWITLDDETRARAVHTYDSETFWKSERGGVRTRVGAYHRTLSAYLNMLVNDGFVFEQMWEPVEAGQEIPSLLFVRAHTI
jgi:2-polyprenyl-3-methyl-5-hydroxy-6-metoxy-1,4-benzoquinol methylase